MAKVTKNIVDKALRDSVFDILFSTGNSEQDAQLKDLFHKVNDRQYGIIMTDLNGNHRYIRLGAIVAEERDDMTAEELMQSEIETYNAKQESKAEKAKAKAEKAAKDKAKREAEKEKSE